MPPLLPVLLLPLASCQLVEVLRHGSIFGWLRDAAQAAEQAPKGLRWVLTPLRALNCPFCFSHWAAAICVGLVFCGTPGLIVLLWLSATRAANLVNDLTKTWNRTPPRAPEDVLKGVETEHLEEEFIRRTSRPFGVPPGSIQGTGPQPETRAAP